MSCAKMTRGMADSDEGAWREFHALYFDWLYASALTRSPNRADASEVVQLTFLRAVRHIKVFKDEAQFKNWLRCLMRCVVIDQARKIKRRSLFMEKFTLWQELRKPSERYAESQKNIDEMLSTLPSKDAVLIQRKYLEGWSTKELAECEQTTPKAIESRLARLRKRLKIDLTPQQEG